MRFFRDKVSEPADLVQETFLACREHIDRFREEASFRTFLFSIASNVLGKFYRAKAGPRGKVDLGTVSVEDLGESPSRVLAEREERRLLLLALRRLSVEQQTLLELHYWERMTDSELSVVLGLSLGTVKTRKRAARVRLKRIIEELASSPGLAERTLTELGEQAAGQRDEDDD